MSDGLLTTAYRESNGYVDQTVPDTFIIIFAV